MKFKFCKNPCAVFVFRMNCKANHQNFRNPLFQNTEFRKGRYQNSCKIFSAVFIFLCFSNSINTIASNKIQSFSWTPLRYSVFLQLTTSDFFESSNSLEFGIFLLYFEKGRKVIKVPSFFYIKFANCTISTWSLKNFIPQSPPIFS